MPLVAGDVCIWHMPKCAGTFVARYVISACGGRRVGNGHDPARYAERLGLHGQGLRHFGLVRDPWSWYASWWRYARRLAPERGSDSMGRYGGDPDDFRATLRGATRATVRELPLCFVTTDSKAEAEPPDGRVGLWSWTVDYMYRTEHRWAVQALLDAGRIYEALDEALGWRLDPGEWRPHNTAGTNERRGVPPQVTDYAPLYDAEMSSWVDEADGALARRLGYEPRDGQASRPVVYLSDGEVGS